MNFGAILTELICFVFIDQKIATTRLLLGFVCALVCEFGWFTVSLFVLFCKLFVDISLTFTLWSFMF